jgi:hypothetical protein
MAENNDPNWRDRLSTSRDSDKRKIDDALNTTAGTVTVTVILIALFGWAIISSFIK